jgi:hypothetical protein
MTARCLSARKPRNLSKSGCLSLDGCQTIRDDAMFADLLHTVVPEIIINPASTKQTNLVAKKF